MVFLLNSKVGGTEPAVPRGLGQANRAQLRKALAEEAYLKPEEIFQHRIKLAINAAKDRACIGLENGEIMFKRGSAEGSFRCSVPKGYFADFVEKVVQFTNQQRAPHFEEAENIFVKRLAENNRSFLREDDAYHERTAPGAKPSRILDPRCIEEELYLYEPLNYWDDEQQKVMREIIEKRVKQLLKEVRPTSTGRRGSKSSPKSRRGSKIRASSSSPERRASSKGGGGGSDLDEDDIVEDDTEDPVLESKRLAEERKAQAAKELMRQRHEEKMGQAVQDLENDQEDLRRQIEAAKAALAAAESQKAKMQVEVKASAEKADKLRTELKADQQSAGQMRVGVEATMGQRLEQGRGLHPEEGDEQGVGQSALLQQGSDAQTRLPSSASPSSQALVSAQAPESQHLDTAEDACDPGVSLNAADDGGVDPEKMAKLLEQARAREEERAAKERARLKARVSELLKLIASLEASDSHDHHRAGHHSLGKSLAPSGGSTAPGADKRDVDSGVRSAAAAAAAPGARASQVQEADETLHDREEAIQKQASTTKVEDSKMSRPDSPTMKKMLVPPVVRGIFRRLHEEAQIRLIKNAASQAELLAAQEDSFVKSMESNGTLGKSMELNSTLGKSMESNATLGKSMQSNPTLIKSTLSNATVGISRESTAKLESTANSTSQVSTSRSAANETFSAAAPAAAASPANKPCPQLVAAHSQLDRRNRTRQASLTAAKPEGLLKRSESFPQRGRARGNEESDRGSSSNSRGSFAQSQPVSRASTGGKAMGISRDDVAQTRPVSRGHVEGNPVSRGSTVGKAMDNSKDDVTQNRPVSRGHVESNPVSRGSTLGKAMDNSRDDVVQTRATRPVSRGHVEGNTVSRGNVEGNGAASRPVSRGHAEGKAGDKVRGRPLTLACASIGDNIASMGDNTGSIMGGSAMRDTKVPAAWPRPVSMSNAGGNQGSAMGNIRGTVPTSRPVSRGNTPETWMVPSMASFDASKRGRSPVDSIGGNPSGPPGCKAGGSAGGNAAGNARGTVAIPTRMVASMAAAESSSRRKIGGTGMNFSRMDLDDCTEVEQAALDDIVIAGRSCRETDKHVKDADASLSDMTQQDDLRPLSLGPPDHWGRSVLHTTKAPSGKL